MQKLPIAVTISTALHAVAVAWAAMHPARPRSAPEPTQLTAIEVVQAPDPAPALDLALLAAPADDPPAPAAATPSPTPRPPNEVSFRPAPAVTAAHPTAPPPNEVSLPSGSAARAAAPDRPSLLAMRRDQAPRLSLPAGRWDDLDHPPAGTSPEKTPRASGQLSESGGGTYRADGGEFTAKVNADGTVKLTDKPNLHVHVALPSAKSLGRGLSNWYDSEKGTFGEHADPALSKQIQVTSGTSTDPDDPVTNRNKDRTPTVIVPVIGGGFDANDWLMRRHGQDPYASKKLAMLDATRDERVQIGGKHKAEQLRRAPQIVQRNLEAMWAATRDPQARKQALFEMWDECVETGDLGVVEAAQLARRLIIGFIRARIPAGSPGAFTAAEIAACSRARHSTAAFVPYE